MLWKSKCLFWVRWEICQSLHQWEGTIAPGWNSTWGVCLCLTKLQFQSLSPLISSQGLTTLLSVLSNSAHPSRHCAQSYSKHACQMFEWFLCAHGSKVKGTEEAWHFSLIVWCPDSQPASSPPWGCSVSALIRWLLRSPPQITSSLSCFLLVFGDSNGKIN